MKTLGDAGQFRWELTGWTIRGILCALPSVAWASAVGFTHPRELAAVAVVAGCCIAAFAGFSASTALDRDDSARRWLAALKMAAWTKGIAGSVATVMAVASLRGASGLGLLAWGTWPDIWAGRHAIRWVNAMTGLQDSIHVSRLDSFQWTARIAAGQALLIATMIVVLAAVIRMVAGLKARYSGHVISPARSTG